jgi:hypothetical protein
MAAAASMCDCDGVSVLSAKCKSAHQAFTGVGGAFYFNTPSDIDHHPDGDGRFLYLSLWACVGDAIGVGTTGGLKCGTLDEPRGSGDVGDGGRGG